MLAVKEMTLSPPMSSRTLEIPSAIRSAISAAEERSASGRITANSSPPYLAAMSVFRRWAPNAPATSASTRSPVVWPYRSLISLKWSRSSMMTAIGRTYRFARSSSMASFSWNAPWL